ncbi:MAG: oligosaccharide flippase family protein [Candidatus Lokiarchaeota archaeon]|nr:oligosaccharide flippase family protein [Candidatus Lokiarchaeota archaeon]
MIARKSVIILITTFLIKILDVVIFYLATNKYTLTDFYYLTMARAIFTFFILFADLNFNLAHVKKMAERTHSRNTYFTTYFVFKIILLPIVSMLFIAIIDIQTMMGMLPDVPELRGTMWFILAASVVNSLNLVYQGSFQAEMKISRMQAGNVIAIAIKSILTIYIVFFVEGFLFFVSLFLVYELITLGINIVLGRAYRFTSINRGLMREYIKFGAFFLVLNSTQIFYTNFGPLILQQTLGEPPLAVYYVISRLLSFFTIIQTSLNALFLPHISSSLKNNDIPDIRDKITLYQKYMLIIWGVVVITCFGVGKILLGYLGAGGAYEQQGLALFLFQIVTYFSWAWMPYYLMIMLKEDPKFMIVVVTSLVFSLISWFLLPGVLGIISIEFGKHFAEIPNVIFITYYVQKKFGFGKPGKNAIITILLTILFIVIELILGLNRLQGAGAIILTMMLLLVYIVLLFMFRVLKVADIEFFKGVMSPRQLYLEIRSDSTNSWITPGKLENGNGNHHLISPNLVIPMENEKNNSIVQGHQESKGIRALLAPINELLGWIKKFLDHEKIQDRIDGIARRFTSLFEKRQLLMLMAVVVVAFILRATLVNMSYPLIDDNFHYMIKAIEISKGNWTPMQPWGMGWSIILAPFMAMMNSSSIFEKMLFISFLSLVFEAAAIIPLFYSTKLLVNHRVAIIASVLYAVFIPDRAIALLGMTEPAYVFLVLLAFTFILKSKDNWKYLVPAGLVSGLILESRSSGIMAVVALFLAILFTRKDPAMKAMIKHVVIFGVFFLALAGPFMAWRAAWFGSPFEYGPNTKLFIDDFALAWAENHPEAPSIFEYLASHSLFQVADRFIIDGLAREFYQFFILLFPLVLFVFFIVGLLKITIDKQRRVLVLVLIALFLLSSISYAFLSNQRHLLVLIPFAMVLAAYGMVKIVSSLHVRRKKVIMAVLLGACCLSMIIPPVQERFSGSPDDLSSFQYIVARNRSALVWGKWIAENLHNSRIAFIPPEVLSCVTATMVYFDDVVASPSPYGALYTP